MKLKSALFKLSDLAHFANIESIIYTAAVLVYPWKEN